MIYKEEEKELKKPKIYKIWNFLIYGSSIAIGVFLVYLYSAYVFINKWSTCMAEITYGILSLLLICDFAYFTFKLKG